MEDLFDPLPDLNELELQGSICEELTLVSPQLIAQFYVCRCTVISLMIAMSQHQ